LDGNGGTDTATVTVTVGPVNDAPVANDDVATTNEDVAVSIQVLANDTDPDGDSLTIDSFTQPANGAVADNGDGTVTYTPDPDFNGEDTFTYTILDGNGETDTATVTVNVGPVNDSPVALDDIGFTISSVPFLISVLLNDTDLESDVLMVTIISPPSSGSLVINVDGTVTYTPEDNFVGQDSFEYQIDDGHGGTDTATVIIIVDRCANTVEDHSSGSPDSGCSGGDGVDGGAVDLICLLFNNEEPETNDVGDKCVPCVNSVVDHSTGASDSGCPGGSDGAAGEFFCVNSNGSDPVPGEPGEKCAPCINSYDGPDSTVADLGCGSGDNADALVCINLDGTLPDLYSAGEQCVSCVNTNVDPADPSTDLGCPSGSGDPNAAYCAKADGGKLNEGESGGTCLSCGLAVEKKCRIVPYPPGASSSCKDAKPINEFSMIWNGQEPVTVEAFKGDESEMSLGVQTGIVKGQKVSFSGFDGAPNNVYWKITDSNGIISFSIFHLSCSGKKPCHDCIVLLFMLACVACLLTQYPYLSK
jgi:hypothetical protein